MRHKNPGMDSVLPVAIKNPEIGTGLSKVQDGMLRHHQSWQTLNVTQRTEKMLAMPQAAQITIVVKVLLSCSLITLAHCPISGAK